MGMQTREKSIREETNYNTGGILLYPVNRKEEGKRVREVKEVGRRDGSGRDGRDGKR